MFGKENNNTATINETVTNQISETSSRAYIECSFTNFDKRKKSRHKGNKKMKIIKVNASQGRDLNNLLEKQTLQNNNEIIRNHNNNFRNTQTELIKSEFQIIINDHSEMLDMNDFKDKIVSWK